MLLELQLHFIIHEPHFLPVLECRHPYVGTPVAPERIAQCTVPAAANLPLNGKVHLREFVALQLCKSLIGLRALGGVFCFETLSQPAGAVFTSAATLAGSGVLPFERASFEATIGTEGRAAQASLRGFGRAYDRARQQPEAVPPPPAAPDLPALPRTAGHPALG